MITLTLWTIVVYCMGLAAGHYNEKYFSQVSIFDKLS